MKKFLNILLAFTIIISSVFSLTACSFGDGDYKASYKKQTITRESVSSIMDTIEKNTIENLSYSKYEATYKSDYKSNTYDYNTKYDVSMKVNGDAKVGEVFAYIELKSVYEQSDGQHGRDLLVKYCIVRISEGKNFSDYKVYMNIGEETHSATFSEMHDKIAEEDVYLEGETENLDVSNILDYTYSQGRYFETLYGYGMAITGGDIVSTLDNPLIFCLHEFNKENFVYTLSELTESSKNYGWALYSAGDSAFKITRKYDDKKFLESYDSTAYLKINEDGTYSHKLIDGYKTENPARAFEYKTERELKPLSTAIEVPSWAK